MVQVILVCGEWVLEKKRWQFVVDNRSERGCKILIVDESTSFTDFVQMVYEDYGFDDTKHDFELSYMFGKKLMKGLPIDTPRVVVSNTHQLQGFIALCKSDPIRLSVVVKEKLTDLRKQKLEESGDVPEGRKHKDSDKDATKEVDISKEGSMLGSTRVDDETYITVANVEKTTEDGALEDEEGDLDSRFDCCDDSDGASSEDEDFSVYGMPQIIEPPKLPIKKWTSKSEKKELIGVDACKRLEIPSLDLRVGQRYRSKEDLEQRLKILSVFHGFDFDVDRLEPTLYIVK